MVDVVEIIKSNVSSSFEKLYGLHLEDPGVEHPQNSSWGDYSTNVALVYSKVLGKSPRDIADSVASTLSDITFDSEYLGRSFKLFSLVTVANPGFVNITLSKDYFFHTLAEIFHLKSDYGKRDLGKGKRVALEHSNVNPNKAAHVGHLRNAVIGQFLEHVYEFLGYDVVVQYYSNDLGVQVSTSLLGMQLFGIDVDPKKYQKFDHYAWDVYSKISSMVEEDASLKERLNKLMLSLDHGDVDTLAEQLALSKKILVDNLATFHALSIDYDLVVYESCIKSFGMWKQAFEKLKNNENVYYSTSGPSSGCWLVRVKDKVGDDESSKDASEISDDDIKLIEEDKIIVRSNGIPTYTGKDIAYHMWKFGILGLDFKYKEFKPSIQDKTLYETEPLGQGMSSFSDADLVLDVIDVKQTYAIDVVRKSLGYLGYKTQEDNLIHVNYGHVYLSSETMEKLGFAKSDKNFVGMSGRKGIGVKIDDLVEMVDSRIRSDFPDTPKVSEVRNAVIKFDMLRYDTFQDVVFDVDHALNLKGFTGPYIQYTYARAFSVLEKEGFEDTKVDFDVLFKSFSGIFLSVDELSLLGMLYRFSEVVVSSGVNYAPNLLCTYLHALCQHFNTFYNNQPIINASTPEEKDFRLVLTNSVRQVISNGLYLLGISTVDRM